MGTKGDKVINAGAQLKTRHGMMGVQFPILGTTLPGRGCSR